MTLAERVVCTAYTSVSFLEDSEMDFLKAYAAVLLDRPVDDIDIMSETFWHELSRKSRRDFLRMLK